MHPMRIISYFSILYSFIFNTTEVEHIEVGHQHIQVYCLSTAGRYMRNKSMFAANAA